MSRLRPIPLAGVLVALAGAQLSCTPVPESNAGVGGEKADGAMAADRNEDSSPERVVNTWTVAACNCPSLLRLADAPHAHTEGASALLADGRLLFFAGGPDLVSTDLLDPFLGGWVTAGSSPVDQHAVVGAVTLPDGRVLSVDTGVEPCLLFSPDGGTWGACTASSTRRDAYHLLVLPEGRALYLGGNGPSAAVDLYDPLLDQWLPQAPMALARSDFSGALLDDGSVLVVGANPATVQTERRAPDGSWTDGGTLPEVAGAPCLVRLWDGRVLVGDPGRSLLYEPATGTWTEVVGSGGLGRCRAAALLPDGRVVARFGIPETAWLFDPLQRTWQPGPAFPVEAGAGDGFSALLPTGRWVFLQGGVTQVLDPGTERWEDAAPPPELADQASLTGLSDGNVLLAGGTVASVATRSVARFSPETGWSVAAPLLHARAGQRATLLADGRVLVTGGASQLEPELYDPVTDAWTLLPATPETGAPHTATPLLDGRVLIVSGNTAKLFDPASLQFLGAPAPLASRTGHTATRLQDGRVLLVGGGSATSELFVPGPDTFTASGDLAAARSDSAAVLLPGGEVLVTGGTTAELWHPGTGGWTAAGTLAIQRTGHGALLLRNGKVLLMGGETGAGPAEPELFDPLGGIGLLLPSGASPRVTSQATRLADGRVLVVDRSGGRYLDEGRGGLARAPELTEAQLEAGNLVVSGSGWLSAPQGVDGRMPSAAANVPVLYLERPDTQELRPQPLASWSDEGGVAPHAPALGTAAAFVVVTGVPSGHQRFHVGMADAGCASAWQCATRRCEVGRCCQTCGDGTCRVDGCPSGSPDAGLDGGAELPDAGVDGGQSQPLDLTVACGCGAGGAGPVLLGLLLGAFVLRRKWGQASF